MIVNPELTSKELLCCPFCGGKAIKTIMDSSYAVFLVECIRCGARTMGTPINADLQLAKQYEIAAWNTRVPSEQLTTTQQALDSAVEALKGAFDGLIYAVHLVNGYKHFDEQGNEVLSSSTFGIIKDRCRATEAALASIKE